MHHQLYSKLWISTCGISCTSRKPGLFYPSHACLASYIIPFVQHLHHHQNMHLLQPLQEPEGICLVWLFATSDSIMMMGTSIRISISIVIDKHTRKLQLFLYNSMLLHFKFDMQLTFIALCSSRSITKARACSSSCYEDNWKTPARYVIRAEDPILHKILGHAEISESFEMEHRVAVGFASLLKLFFFG